MSTPDVNSPADALGCLVGLVAVPVLVIFIAVVPVLIYSFLPYVVAGAFTLAGVRWLYLRWRDKRDLML